MTWSPEFISVTLVNCYIAAERRAQEGHLGIGLRINSRRAARVSLSDYRVMRDQGARAVSGGHKCAPAWPRADRVPDLVAAQDCCPMVLSVHEYHRA